MASQKRDRASAELLRRSLGDSAGACLEPEILAAYFERSLDAEETRRYELHLSQCARCREQLAAMHRAGEPSPRGAAQSHVRSHWAWLWDWRFLAPAVAVLMIVAVWIARRPPSTPSTVGSGQPLVAMNERSETPAAPAPTPEKYSPAVSGIPNKALTAPNNGVDKAMKQSSATTEPRSADNGKEIVSNQPRLVGEAAELDELKKDDNSPRRDLADTKSGVAAGAAVARVAPSSAPATAPPPPPPASTSLQGSRVNGGAVGGAISSNEIVASASEAAKAKPSGSPTLVRPMTGQEQRQAIAQSEALVVGDVERRSTGNIINTPNPNVVWHISASGAVELSKDGGATWQKQQLRSFEANPQVTAGYAPTAKICWLVGRDGVILLTRDASHWVPIPPPTTTDFVSVTAKDNFSVTVTAADGRKFSTNDAGDHWKPAP